MKVSICILNYNRRDETVRCIESALKSQYQPCEIVVADNGSTDGSAAVVAAHFGQQVKAVCFDRNYGCPGGRNRAVAHCSGEFVFFLDNDALLGVRTVKLALETIERNPRTAVVGGKYAPFKELPEVDLYRDGCASRRTYPSESFVGGCALVRRSDFVAVGGFPDDYFYGGEEANLSLRLLDRGKLIFYDSAILVWHRMSDLARDFVWEQNKAARNILRTVYSLSPRWLLPILLLNHIVKYARHAMAKGYFRPWVMSLPADLVLQLPLVLRGRRLTASAWYKRILLSRLGSHPEWDSIWTGSVSLRQFVMALWRQKLPSRRGGASEANSVN